LHGLQLLFATLIESVSPCQLCSRGQHLAGLAKHWRPY